MNKHLRAVLKYGEIFTKENGDTFKGSIKASTRATFSLAARACYFEGTTQQGISVGDYIIRNIDQRKYLVQTLQVQPFSPELEYAFFAQCNQIVTLARPSKTEENTFEIYANEIPIFMEKTTRSFKEQNDGLISQDITVIQIPVRYGIRKLDRVYILRSGLPLNECEYFRVDSINDSLTPLVESVDATGIDVMQLTEDRRSGKDSGNSGGDDEYWEG